MKPELRQEVQSILNEIGGLLGSESLPHTRYQFWQSEVGSVFLDIADGWFETQEEVTDALATVRSRFERENAKRRAELKK